MNSVLSFARAMSAALFCCSQPVIAQDLEGLTWREQKCVLYGRAVETAVASIGKDGLRENFLADNLAFIDGGCQGKGNICPVTGAEIEFANLLTVLTMNEGMASTFVPFNCP